MKQFGLCGSLDLIGLDSLPSADCLICTCGFLYFCSRCCFICFFSARRELRRPTYLSNQGLYHFIRGKQIFFDQCSEMLNLLRPTQICPSLRVCFYVQVHATNPFFNLCCTFDLKKKVQNPSDETHENKHHSWRGLLYLCGSYTRSEPHLPWKYWFHFHLFVKFFPSGLHIISNKSFRLCICNHECAVWLVPLFYCSYFTLLP